MSEIIMNKKMVQVLLVSCQAVPRLDDEKMMRVLYVPSKMREVWNLMRTFFASGQVRETWTARRAS